MTSTTSTRPWARAIPLAVCVLAFGAAACAPSAKKADSDATVTTTAVVGDALLEPVAPEITEPPVAEAPVTEPPVTEPPVTEPPVTEPPVTEPPVTEPPVTEPPVTEPPVTRPPAPVIPQPPVRSASYANCSEVRAAGAAPILRGQPGYSDKLDRDGDGVACEK